MANPFVHIELNSTDVDKAKAFYTKLFSWELQDTPMPEGTYTMIKAGDGPGGGMMKHPVPGAPSMWLPYVGVDDVRAATDKVKALGGSIMRDVTEIPEYGSFSIVADPSGAVIGLWQGRG